MHINPSKLVNEHEAAQVLAVSVAALRRWRVEGRGPAFVKIERAVRYRLSDVESYLLSRTVRPTQVPRALE